MIVTTRSDAETRALGERIGRRLTSGSIVLLVGTLGAGKTTIAKGIAAALGVVETVTSPTYTIVSDYEGRMPLHHIDLYRISGEEEFIQLGLDDLLYADGVSLVEWPERAGGSFGDAAVAIELRINADGSRSVSGPSGLLTEEAEHEPSRD